MFLKSDPNQLDQFESNPITTIFCQEILKFEESDSLSCDNYFDGPFEIGIKSNIVVLNKLSTYTMPISVFEEMTTHLEGYYAMEDMKEIGFYFTNKIIEYKKKAQSLLKEIANQEKYSMISVTLPFKKKTLIYIYIYIY